MAFNATPMFPGDLYDTSLRLASSSERKEAQPAGSMISSAKWLQMLELGWQGVIVPEEAGGVDGRLADLASIIEATARHAVPVPLIDRCAVAPALLAAVMDRPGVPELLEALAMGQASVATVLDPSKRAPGTHSAISLDERDGLHGMLKGVDLTEPASHVLFNTLDEGTHQPVLLLLPLEPLLTRARWFEGLDGRVTADFNLDDQVVQAHQVLLRGPGVLDAVERAQQHGSLLTCVQAVGAAGAMIEQTIEYLSTRVQFGVALATFQALRHRVVEMYVAYENASGMVRPLVEQATREHPGNARDIALVKLSLAHISRTWSESGIQLHGGMGMTCETLVARLAMHSLVGSSRYGDQAQCLDWLATQSVAEASAEAA